MNNGFDIFVGTMGRLMQFIAEEKVVFLFLFYKFIKKVKVTGLNFFVLDEADKLLKDEIFYKDIMRIQEMAEEVFIDS
jgi:superfamily II DNA/RNA helicase